MSGAWEPEMHLPTSTRHHRGMGGLGGVSSSPVLPSPGLACELTCKDCQAFLTGPGAEQLLSTLTVSADKQREIPPLIRHPRQTL